MRLCSCFLTFTLFALTQCHLILQPYDQDFQGDFPEPKYFREAVWDGHYDQRYAKDRLSIEARHDAIVRLVQSYLTTMNELGISTWLMHGTLLGWWWGKHVMPWDPDADFMIAEPDMFFLAAYFNMTTHDNYIFEVNPHFLHRDQDDRLNVIDARWIDMVTGLYVDITAARYALDHPQGEGVLYDKNGHEFRDTYLYPLRPTTFEDAPVLIPFKYKEMLVSEYGEIALTQTNFKNHTFDKTKMMWVNDTQQS